MSDLAFKWDKLIYEILESGDALGSLGRKVYDPEALAIMVQVRREMPVLWAAMPKRLRLTRKLWAAVEDQVRRATGEVEAKAPENPEAYAVGLQLGDKTPFWIIALQLPEGSWLNTSGTWLVASQRSGKAARVSPLPLVLEGALRGAQGVSWVIAWREDLVTWRRVAVSKAAMSTVPGVLEMARRHGIPATGPTAALLIRYLEGMEAVNAARFRTFRTYEKVGWLDKDTFLLGRGLVTKYGLESAQGLSGEIAETWMQHPWIVTPGSYAEAMPIGPFGDADAWFAGVVPMVRELPVVAAAIVTALAPVLSRILDFPPVALELCGRTSTGKTTTLRIAASVWGQPSELKRPSMIRSWGLEVADLERAFAETQDVPLFLDDHGTSASPLRASSMAYAALSTGRLGALLTTGETALASHRQHDQGLSTRLLTLFDLPFKSESSTRAQQIEQIRTFLASTYGHLGPAFVQGVICAGPEAWAKWKKTYSKLQVAWQGEAAKHGGAAARIANTLAAMNMTAQILMATVPQFAEVRFDQIFKVLWARLVLEGAGEGRLDVFWEAATVTAHWLSENQDKLWSPGMKGEGPWLGRLDLGYDKANTTPIYVSAVKLGEFLRSAGFKPRVVYRAWKAKGWLPSKRAGGAYMRHIQVGEGRMAVIPLLLPASMEPPKVAPAEK